MRDLNTPKHKALTTENTYSPPAPSRDEPEPEPEQTTQTENTTQEPEQKPGPQAKTNSESATDPEKSFKKPFGSYERTSKWGLRGIDQIASRFLKWLAKDETRDRWKLTKEEHAELLEWAVETAEFYDFTVENPAYGFFGTLFLIYADKGLDAWDMRKLNEKIEAQEIEIELLRRKVKAAEDKAHNPQPEDETPEIKKVREEIERNRIIREKKTGTTTTTTHQQPTRTTRPVKPAVAFEEEEEVPVYSIVEEEDAAPFITRPTKTTAPVKDDDSFDFKSQVDNQFFGKPTVENQNSSAENTKNTPNPAKTEQSANRRPLPKPTVEIGFTHVPGSDHIAEGTDGKLESYAPIHEDKKGRATEIVRCPQSRELFERFVGHGKIFKNAQAKSQYFYWCELYEQGKAPKGGWPEWWPPG